MTGDRVSEVSSKSQFKRKEDTNSIGHKQTDVGVLPEDWTTTELGELSVISRLAGAEYTSVWRETPNGEIIALRGFNIGKNSINHDDIVTISDDLSKKLKRSRLCKGDVVYPCVGTIGNAAVIYEDNKYHIQQNIARITPDFNKLSPEFLAHYLTSSLAYKEVEKFNATSSQPNVLVGSLRQYKLPLPTSLVEQTAIANALSDVDALINSLEKLIAKKQAIKTATMQQLLTGKTRLPQFATHPDGTPKGYKQSELGEIPEDWESTSIGENTSWLSGGTPSRSNESFWSGSIPWISGSTLKSFEISESDQHLTSEAVAAGSKMAPIGSVLLLVRGSALHNEIRSGMVVSPVSFNQDVKALVPGQKLESRFLAFYFMAMESNLLKLVSSAGNSAGVLDTELVKNFPIVLPSILEQEAIANTIADMDKENSLLTQRLTKTRQLKQGMMQELLTGKTRLVKPAVSAA